MGLQNGQSVGSCFQIASEQVLTFLNQASYTVPTDAQTLSTYFNATGVVVDGGTRDDWHCPRLHRAHPASRSRTRSTSTSTSARGTIDLSIPLMVLIDLVPPPAPTGVTVQGGDEALVAQLAAGRLRPSTPICSATRSSAAAPTSTRCSTRRPPTTAGPARRVWLGFLTCPKTRAAMGGLDAGIENLNPLFVCSPQLSAQSTSDRVKILQNDITYGAAVVSIDTSGNASKPADHLRHADQDQELLRRLPRPDAPRAAPPAASARSRRPGRARRRPPPRWRCSRSPRSAS